MGKSLFITSRCRPTLVAILVCGLATPASSQQARQLLGRRFWQQAGPQGYPSLVSLPTPPRELERILSKAERAIQEGEFADAIEKLDRLLRQSDSADYFLAEPDAESANQSFREAALKMLGNLPPEGRELYELQRGAEARQQLDQALRTGELSLLGNITRESLHTRAGQEAALLLARFHLDQQQPVSALLLLRQLEPDAEHDAKLRHDWSLLLAVCWQAAGRPHEAAEVLQQLRRDEPDFMLAVRGKLQPIPESNAEIIEFVSLLVSPDVDWQHIPTWRTMQGSARRDRRSNGGMPLPRVEWIVPAVLLESESHVLAELQRRYADQEVPALLALQPLVAGDYVLVRTPDVSLGVHVGTGKRTWMYPPLRHLEALSGVAAPGESADTLLARSLQQRTWEDSVHAQCSADERRVYLLTDSELPAVDTAQMALRLQQGFGGQQEPPRLRNRLVALETATEGKVLWIVGGQDGDEPRLSEAFFLGPPLPAYGELFLIAEIRDELQLLALAPETGRLKWSQQLLHTEPPFTVGLDESRRLTGAMPSSADGIIVCPTSASAVVAVNAITRSLVWAQRYDPGALDDRVMLDSRLRTLVAHRPVGQRWADGFAMIAAESVLLTPPESDQLHCLDLMSGTPRWPAVSRGEGLYLAGVVNEVLAVVERRAVRSHRLVDGKPAWPPIEIPSGAMPSGRGYISGQYYYLPTTAAELHRIDLEAGRIVETTSSGIVLGNLTCTDRYLISYGPDAIRAFYLRDHMRDRLVQEMQSAPDDPHVLEAYANLLIGDGERRQAVDVLLRCLALQSDATARQRTQELLIQTLFTALRFDFDQFQDLLPIADKWVTSPTDARSLRMIEAAGHWQQEDLDATVRVLLGLAETYDAGQPEAQHPTLEHPVDPSVRVDELTWLAAMLREVFQQGTPEAIDRWHYDLEISWRRLLDAASLSNLRIAQALCPLTRSAHVQRLELVAKLHATGDRLGAELLLGPLLRAPEAQTAGAAWLALAELRASEQRPAEAAQAYQQSLQLAPQSDSRASRQLLTCVEDWSDAETSETTTWPVGATVVQPPLRRASPLATTKSVQSLIQVQWLDAQGVPVDGRQALFEPNRRDLLVLDRWGRRVGHFPQQIKDPVRNVAGAATLFAKSDAQLVVFALGDQIFATRLPTSDFEDAVVLWERNLSRVGEPAVPRVNVQRFRVQTSVNPFRPAMSREVSRPNDDLPVIGPVVSGRATFWHRHTLECVDAQSGKTRWRRRNVTDVADVWGDAEHVYVISTGTTARVFRMSDGAEVGRREVPALKQHWATRGRMILAFESRRTLFNRQFVKLFLWDPWTESMVWQHRYNKGARGCLVETDEVAIADTDGEMDILRLADGEAVASFTWTARDALGLSVWRDEDRYICQLEVPERATGAVRLRGPAAAIRRRPQSFSGQLMALDRATGGPLWSGVAEIHQFFLPTYQPSGLPLLPMFRMIHDVPRREEEGDRARPRMRPELICIDLRSGALAARSDSAVNFRTMMPLGDPAQDVISISSERGEVYRLQLTSERVRDARPALVPPLDANQADE